MKKDNGKISVTNLTLFLFWVFHIAQSSPNPKDVFMNTPFGYAASFSSLSSWIFDNDGKKVAVAKLWHRVQKHQMKCTTDN